METFLKDKIHPTTLGILYLCKYTYNPPSIIVVKEIQFDNAFDALEAYSNTRNPESQIVAGKTKEEMFKELEQLHKNLNDKEWVASLGDYL